MERGDSGTTWSREKPSRARAQSSLRMTPAQPLSDNDMRGLKWDQRKNCHAEPGQPTAP